jgi:hypothetical protein
MKIFVAVLAMLLCTAGTGHADPIPVDNNLRFLGCPTAPAGQQSVCDLASQFLGLTPYQWAESPSGVFQMEPGATQATLSIDYQAQSGDTVGIASSLPGIGYSNLAYYPIFTGLQGPGAQAILTLLPDGDLGISGGSGVNPGEAFEINPNAFVFYVQNSTGTYYSSEDLNTEPYYLATTFASFWPFPCGSSFTCYSLAGYKGVAGLDGGNNPPLGNSVFMSINGIGPVDQNLGTPPSVPEPSFFGIVGFAVAGVFFLRTARKRRVDRS